MELTQILWLLVIGIILLLTFVGLIVISLPRRTAQQQADRHNRTIAMKQDYKVRSTNDST